MKSLAIIALAIIVCIIRCSPKSSPGQKPGHIAAAKDKNIDWEGYDTASITGQQNITTITLQGLWSAYDGVFRFGSNISTMKLNIPFIIEVKNDSCRRNAKDDFQKFFLKDNSLLIPDGIKTDTGIINKISPSELVISWKRRENYSRYYYKK